MTKPLFASRAVDLLVFAVLLLVMLAGASRLAVYDSAPADADHPASSPAIEPMPAPEPLHE